MKKLSIFAATLLLTFLFVAPAIAMPNADGTIDCTNTEDTEFVPSWGQVYVDEDQYTRFIYQWFYWDKIQRMTWFNQNTDSTFEPDGIFYNYSGQAYGGEPIGYWASDLPSAYVDTQFGDDPEEKAVTIGSANALYMNHGHVYYTVTRMTNGGGDSSWVKLSAQRGRRYPYTCYSTFCSFGCQQQANNIFVLPYRTELWPDYDEFTAPGCARYWYKWDIIWYETCQ